MVTSRHIIAKDGGPVIHTDEMISMYRQHFASIGCEWAAIESDERIVKNFEHRYGTIFHDVQQAFSVSTEEAVSYLNRAFENLKRGAEVMQKAIERINSDSQISSGSR